jgi:glycosyltransferase involved in cell wall biosynthesis
MRPLRIGIDVHSIGSRKGGNETYYRELVRGLVKARSQHRFFLYHCGSYVKHNLPSDERFAQRRLYPEQRMLRIPFTIPWRSRVDELDLFHAQFIVPPFLNCRTVTTIPDIAYEHYPDLFPVHQRTVLRMLVPESARRADHIITVSEHSKMDLVNTYGISREKITVTYEGAGEEFVPWKKEEAKDKLARKYGIVGDFILYVGRLQARKNLVRLVNAYAKIRAAGFPHKLVLAGPQDGCSLPVKSRISELKLDCDVLLPGYVAQDDLPAFYSAADIFVYPSVYEGFGLPLVEAMACGTAVIASRSSSLAEVAGDAALLVDALDEQSILDSLRRLLLETDVRLRLGRAGLKRCRDFSFEIAARQTIEVYERVINMDRVEDRSSQTFGRASRTCL